MKRKGSNIEITVTKKSKTYVQLSLDVLKIIQEYESKSKLRDWILKDNIIWSSLSKNPSEGAIRLLEKNMDKINWDQLSENPNEGAIRLLEQNIDKINWCRLSSNTNESVVRLLEKNVDKINWINLFANTSESSRLLVKNQDSTFVWDLAEHALIEGFVPNTINRSSDGDNIQWLERNMDEIDWSVLSNNTSEGAIRLLEKNTNKIDWSGLSNNTNEGVMRLLEKNMDKLKNNDWSYLLENPAIFITDSNYMIHLLELL